jgi:hypothetical protein
LIAAVIVVEPRVTEFAWPVGPMTATPMFEEDHSTWVDTLSDELSLKWAAAVNTWPAPKEISALFGEIEMDVRVAAVVLTVDVLTTPANTAVILAGPGVIPATEPLEPGMLLIVATDGGVHVHVTVLVRFCVFPSRNFPIAVSGRLNPAGTSVSDGLMVIDTSGEDSTTKAAEPLTLLRVAAMVVLPAAKPTAWPIGFTVATPVSDELQVATLVMFWTDVSEYVPAAEKPCMLPGMIRALEGEMAIILSLAELTVKEVEPTLPPNSALISETPW